MGLGKRTGVGRRGRVKRLSGRTGGGDSRCKDTEVRRTQVLWSHSREFVLARGQGKCGWRRLGTEAGARLGRGLVVGHAVWASPSGTSIF